MMPNMNTNYCALYMRTSTKATASQIERWEKPLMAEIQRRSITDGPDAWKIVDSCFDKGLTPFATASSFQNLIHQIEEGLVSCIVVPELDRLIRSRSDQQEFLGLASRTKFRLISVIDCIDIESTDFVGVLMAFATAGFQRAVRQERSRRATEAWKRRRENQPIARNQ